VRFCPHSIHRVDLTFWTPLMIPVGRYAARGPQPRAFSASGILTSEAPSSSGTSLARMPSAAGLSPYNTNHATWSHPTVIQSTKHQCPPKQRRFDTTTKSTKHVHHHLTELTGLDTAALLAENLGTQLGLASVMPTPLRSPVLQSSELRASKMPTKTDTQTKAPLL
jgi:hypothetical protein